MKVIKRDGRAVDYNRDKIITAIEKANSEVKGRQKATKEQIKEITNYKISLLYAQSKRGGHFKS